MKNILFIILLFPVLLMGQSKKENYVKTVTYKKPSTQLIGIEDTIVNVTYYDGLGRTKQVIAAKAGGNGQDIVVPVFYDSKGRQATQYLPYANPVATAASSSLNYRPNDALVTDQFNYYKSRFSSDFFMGFKSSFGQDLFEQSPLNRVVEKSFPGDTWDTGRKSLKFEYGSNSLNDAVFDFRVAFTNNDTEKPYIYLIGGRVNSQFYVAGALYKTISKNENWVSTDGDNNTVHEYKDKQGRLILERKFNEGIAHNTYYVYDVFGNLTFVLSPQAFATSGFITSVSSDFLITFVIDNAIFQKFCYTYKYDSRNRVIEKYIPGSGWSYMVYDKLDRLTMTQHENMRAKTSPDHNWLFTGYDAFNRVALTGSYYTGTTHKQLRDLFETSAILNETRSSTPVINNGMKIYYTNTGFGYAGPLVLTVNYYDDYNFERPNIDVPVSTLYHPLTSTLKSLLTGSLTRVLGTLEVITTVNGYDEKGKLIWTKNNDPYFISNNTFQAKLDFTGKTVETKSEHEKMIAGVPKKVTVSDYFSYDGSGRPLLHTQKVNDAAVAELISLKRYNELGDLIGKNIGGLNNGRGTLQTIDYSYHLKGWLTAINNVNSLGKDLFAENIYYNAPLTGTALYNGNISQVAWKTANDNNLRTYSYTYDALNRIKTAGFVNSNTVAQNGSFELKNVTYDRNGNITFLHRSGDKVAGSAQENMDVMSYEYDGNQLKRIKEDGLITSGFTTGILPSNTVAQYAYDTAGNLKLDTNKKISNIDYNHLNLPTKVTFNNGRYIEYAYNALGGKLKKTHYNGVTTAVTEYNNGFVYSKSGSSTSALQYFSTEEGYVSFKDDNTFSYVYQHKDHLGNIRLSYSDTNGDGIISDTQKLIEGFENGSGWSNDYFGATISYDSSKKRSGNFSAKYVNPPSFNNEVYVYSDTSVSINNSQPTQYTYSAWYMSDGPEAQIWLVGKKADGTIVHLDSSRSTVTGQQWIQLVNTITVPTDIKSLYIRLDNNWQGTIWFDDVSIIRTDGVSEIIEENNYEPFGLKHTGYNNTITSNGNSTAQKRGLNGKELEKAEEYNMNEMDWRHYDPAIARWVCTDPVIHHNSSPYSAFDNNPVRWSDPSGLFSMSWFYDNSGDYNWNTGQYKSGSLGGALANIGIDYDSMGNGSKGFEFESQGMDYSEFESTGGGGGGPSSGGYDLLRKLLYSYFNEKSTIKVGPIFERREKKYNFKSSMDGYFNPAYDVTLGNPCSPYIPSGFGLTAYTNVNLGFVNFSGGCSLVLAGNRLALYEIQSTSVMTSQSWGINTSYTFDVHDNYGENKSVFDGLKGQGISTNGGYIYNVGYGSSAGKVNGTFQSIPSGTQTYSVGLGTGIGRSQTNSTLIWSSWGN